MLRIASRNLSKSFEEFINAINLRKLKETLGIKLDCIIYHSKQV